MNIIHGDCLDGLLSLPDGCVDAVITDPPYCSGAFTEYGRSAAKSQGLRSETIKRIGWFKGDNMGTQGLMYLLRQMAFESIRLLKDSGSLLIFCDWRMAPNIAPAIESAGLRYQNMIIWDKGAIGLGTGFRTQHEIILHFTAGQPKYYDKGTSNVIKSKRVSPTERQHQTQKPVNLIEQLINVVCPPGGTVLDPFGGSGSTAVAAVNTGRDFILCERDIAHVETSWSRVYDAMIAKGAT